MAGMCRVPDPIEARFPPHGFGSLKESQSLPSRVKPKHIRNVTSQFCIRSTYIYTYNVYSESLLFHVLFGPVPTATRSAAWRPFAPWNPFTIHWTSLDVAHTVFIRRALASLTSMGCCHLLGAFPRVDTTIAGTAATTPTLPGRPLTIHRTYANVTIFGLIEISATLLVMCCHVLPVLCIICVGVCVGCIAACM